MEQNYNSSAIQQAKTRSNWRTAGLVLAGAGLLALTYCIRPNGNSDSSSSSENIQQPIVNVIGDNSPTNVWIIPGDANVWIDGDYQIGNNYDVRPCDSSKPVSHTKKQSTSGNAGKSTKKDATTSIDSVVNVVVPAIIDTASVEDCVGGQDLMNNPTMIYGVRKSVDENRAYDSNK